MSSATLHSRWPWQDRKGNFDWLKASTFALMFYPTLWTLYYVDTGGFGPLLLVGLIYWSGVWATALLLLALFITPASRILRWKRIISVRRIVGVSALFHTIAHIIIYFALYRWDFNFLFMDMVSRPTLVVATISTLGLIALGATSFDAAVQAMGGRNWKRLHRTNYLLTGLAITHYLLSPGIFSLQYVAAGTFFWLMAWRWMSSKGRGTDLNALVALAIMSCLFTIFLQAGWMWVYHSVDLRQTLADNFSMISGVPAGYTVLGIGLLFASVPLVARTSRMVSSGEGL